MFSSGVTRSILRPHADDQRKWAKIDPRIGSSPDNQAYGQGEVVKTELPHARTRAHKRALTSGAPDCSASFRQIVDHLGAVNGSINSGIVVAITTAEVENTQQRGGSLTVHFCELACCWYNERYPPSHPKWRVL